MAPFDAAPGAEFDDAKIICVSAMVEKIIEYAQKRLADREFKDLLERSVAIGVFWVHLT